jgi:predicted DNA-binding transcriptional regulator YafY
MRSDRLLSLLLLLQARTRLTAPEAAAELQVSVRTIYRDVEALSAAGVPVYTEQGQGGGIRLLDGYRTDVTGLTATESRALVAMTGRALPDGLGLGEALASALRKLVVAVPPAHRRAAEAARERVLVDHHGWNREPRQVPLLAQVQDAVWADHRIRVRYRHASPPGQARGYLLDPWGLVVKAGVWYLVAAHRGTPRVFRVDRLLWVAELVEPSRRPDGLDLAQVWQRLRADVERVHDAVPVRLRVRADVAGMLLRVTATQRVEPAAAPAPGGPEPAAEDDGAEDDGADEDGADEDGWVTLALVFRALGAARGSLLGFGAAVEVLAPAELRADLARTAAEVVDLYHRGPGPGDLPAGPGPGDLPAGPGPGDLPAGPGPGDLPGGG